VVVDRVLRVVAHAGGLNVFETGSGYRRCPAASGELPARIARESGDPSRLAFEITETAAIENIESIPMQEAVAGCGDVLSEVSRIAMAWVDLMARTFSA